MEVILNISFNESLENARPAGNVEWLLVASGYWSQDPYHDGHIAYYLAKTASDAWVMDSVQRSDESTDEISDDVEFEPSDADDFQRIVAVCKGARLDAKPKDIATELYRLVCNAGGIRIDDADDFDGLLEL